jgi:hypothetical protein
VKQRASSVTHAAVADISGQYRGVLSRRRGQPRRSPQRFLNASIISFDVISMDFGSPSPVLPDAFPHNDFSLGYGRVPMVIFISRAVRSQYKAYALSAYF